MGFDIKVFRARDENLEFTIEFGEYIFVLGANGAGKSSLLNSIYNHHMDARYIFAHRQNWFASDSVDISPNQRMEIGNNLRITDSYLESSWKDSYSTYRPSMAVYDIIDAENVRARLIADAIDKNNIELAIKISQTSSPLMIINEIFEILSIPIEISIQENDRLVASKNNSLPYGITQLSDGERNLIMIAANVLTAKPGTLFLLDEPERHLHRSIISLLLSHLFDQRPDCAFIVSTHDVTLPLDNPKSRVLLLRNCTYGGSSLRIWDADLVSTEFDIDDEIKKAILGGRRKIVFIEGNENSLDKAMYSLLFSRASVIAKSSCRDVEYAVNSIRSTKDLHWIQAFGIIDNDLRTQEDIEQLKRTGIYAISVFSVESIYYHPEIQRRISERRELLTGEESSLCLVRAKDAALEAMSAKIQHLSERVAEKSIRQEIFRYLPRRQDIVTQIPINISIDVSEKVNEEKNRLQDILKKGDLLQAITQYPVRETAALLRIANNLGFQDRKQYERAVIKLLTDDESALAFVRSLFGTLELDINAE